MSWFRNLTAYRLGKGAALTADQLVAHAFQPCGDLDAQTAGFVPIVEGGDLAYVIPGGHVFLAFCTEKKNLPKQVIDRKTRERCRAIENEQGFRPGRKQTKEIRGQVIDELLPKAFTTRAITRVWLDPVGGWFAVGTPSTTRAEDVFATLYRAVEGLPVTSLRVNRSPSRAMTDWLAADEAPFNFTVDSDTELQSLGEGKAAVRYLRALPVDDAQRHIAGGKQCTRLAMTWADRISFVLTDGLVLKSIEPLDVLKEGDAEVRDDRERLDADLALMAGEFRRLLSDLVDALGGEFEEAAA